MRIRRGLEGLALIIGGRLKVLNQVFCHVGIGAYNIRICVCVVSRQQPHPHYRSTGVEAKLTSMKADGAVLTIHSVRGSLTGYFSPRE